ncbi:hypothetical protein OEZ86_008947 [Tetradesmus obliquus]|nr:hypothetical protein OEZ86_008947 [Tetradesmus obliquus]
MSKNKQQQALRQAVEDELRVHYTDPKQLKQRLAQCSQDADLLIKLQPAPNQHDSGEHFEAALFCADPSLFSPAAHPQQQQQQQARTRRCRNAALRALLVSSCKQPGLAQLPQHTVEPPKPASTLAGSPAGKPAGNAAGLAGLESPLVLLLRRVAIWWLYHVAYAAPAHLAWLARDCELLFRLLAPQQQLACMAEILTALACPAFYTDKEELQLSEDFLGKLDTPEHTATLLSMLRLAQQLAVAEAVQQQQQQQARSAADKEALAGQPTIAALQPPALVLLRIMRTSAAAAATAGQQQQQRVPPEMMKQLALLQMEQGGQQQRRHLMWGPVMASVTVSSPQLQVNT